MHQDLNDRLRRLGLGKGTAAIKPSDQNRNAIKVENLIPGRLISDGHYTCFLVENSYPLDYMHGNRSLGSVLEISTKDAAIFSRDESIKTYAFQDYIFLDTETTGLSAGAGTIAFMVGIGFFTKNAFVVNQYFLRSPSDELMMLEHLSGQLQQRPGLISFNGRSFDIPLLANRYILNRKTPPFEKSPHLDLLHSSRRLWSNSLESCRLTALEAEVLGVQRDQTDIPGGVIPMIYRDYLMTGNGIEMPRIFYHNQIDVLSMVGLADLICRSFRNPQVILKTGLEWIALGAWYESLDMKNEAENAYRKALLQNLPQEEYESVLNRLGWLLKRMERREEAAVVWLQLASVEIKDVKGHVELSKYHEWRTGDLEQAIYWIQQAIDMIKKWPFNLYELAHPELSYRLERLERKMVGKLKNQERQ